MDSILKIYDEGCQICEEMASFDHAAVGGLGMPLILVSFTEIVDGDFPELALHLLQHFLDEKDGSVSLPLYFKRRNDGSLTTEGLQGWHSQDDFVRQVGEIK